MNPALVGAMDAGGPYGMGWPAPRIAAGPFRVIRADLVGTHHVRAIVAGADGRSLKAMAFRQADTAWARRCWAPAVPAAYGWQAAPR